MTSRESVPLDAVEIGRNGGFWQPIPRAMALAASRTRTVAVIHRGLGRDTATLFDPSNRFYRANGPYLYDGLRYFLYMGPGGGADNRLKKSLGMPSKPPETEWEPLEFEDQATGEMRSLGSPVKKKTETYPIEFQLQDAAGKAVAGTEYEVVLPDGSIRRGATGADGFVRIADNMHKGEAKLTLKPKHGHESAVATSGATSGAASGSAAAPGPEEAGGGFSLAALLDRKPEAPALPVVPMPVEILLTDADGLPMPKTAFRARFPDGAVVSGESDQAGLIRFPDNTQTGEIELTLPGLAEAGS